MALRAQRWYGREPRLTDDAVEDGVGTVSKVDHGCIWLTGGWVDADIGGADEGRSLQGAVVLSCVGLQLISLGVGGAQEAGESRSLCHGQQ